MYLFLFPPVLTIPGAAIPILLNTTFEIPSLAATWDWLPEISSPSSVERVTPAGDGSRKERNYFGTVSYYVF